MAVSRKKVVPHDSKSELPLVELCAETSNHPPIPIYLNISWLVFIKKEILELQTFCNYYDAMRHCGRF